MAFINTTGLLGELIVDFTTNTSGSLFMALLLILIFFIVFALMFRIPLEYSMALVLPLLLVYMAYTSEFLAIGGIILIYLGIVFAKLFFLR